MLQGGGLYFPRAMQPPFRAEKTVCVFLGEAARKENPLSPDRVNPGLHRPEWLV